jgi:hypothetical protein
LRPVKAPVPLAFSVLCSSLTVFGNSLLLTKASLAFWSPMTTLPYRPAFQRTPLAQPRSSNTKTGRPLDGAASQTWPMNSADVFHAPLLFDLSLRRRLSRKLKDGRFLALIGVWPYATLGGGKRGRHMNEDTIVPWLLQPQAIWMALGRSGSRRLGWPSR